MSDSDSDASSSSSSSSSSSTDSPTLKKKRPSVSHKGAAGGAGDGDSWRKRDISEEKDEKAKEEGTRKRRASERSEDKPEPSIASAGAGSAAGAAAAAAAAADDDDDDDGWIGPMPSEAAPLKKQKVLEYERVYLEDLPAVDNYERSYMHRDTVTHVAVTPFTDFIITGSVDGHVKFWKKQPVGIEFVKHFRAHMGNIQDLVVNSTGTLMCTVSNDENGKVFDVENFDMINMLRLGFAPECAEWIHRSGDAIAALAVAEQDSARVHVFDGRGDSVPLRTIERMHFKPVNIIKYNPIYDVVLSSDSGSGMLEYWSGPRSDYRSPPKNVSFDSKLDTDLFEFAKNKSHALSLTVAPDGKTFVAFSSDKKVRVFKFLTAKLTCVIDESQAHYVEMQQVKQIFPSMEFNKKVSTERDVEKAGVLRHNNIVFDKTGHFILYASMAGIKLVNLYTKRCVRMMGGAENMRYLNIALIQGAAAKVGGGAATTIEMQASENPNIDNTEPDPTLICSAYKKNRFYMFSRRRPFDASSVDAERDVFNEKPSKEDIIAASTEERGAPRLYEAATIHTTQGDIFLKLFPRECPKTVENFCVHARNGYFNGHLFHRVIKQFMIQTGDPTNIGTGGESIWGGEFEDEFHPKLRHDRPYTVSSANAGPNTNGSQFFITVVPTPWLDNKHTVFGRVVRGMEVALNISNAKTHPKTDKPYDDISVVSVSMKEPVQL